MSNLTSAPKSLQLWISTRKTNRILSDPNHQLTSQEVSEIKEICGLTITKQDIVNFPKVLKSFNSYSSKIYRGVFTTDQLLLELLAKGSAKTSRYYSFSKNFFWAKEFGNKIVLSIETKHNFDINKYSKEGEVILDKNIHLKVINQIPNYKNLNVLLIELVETNSNT